MRSSSHMLLPARREHTYCMCFKMTLTVTFQGHTKEVTSG